MTIPSIQSDKLDFLLFDTNILGYLLDSKLKEQITGIIDETRKVYEIGTSHITYYELIKRGRKDVFGLLELLAEFKTFEIDKEVLRIAGLMYCLGIKDCGDSIIASTSFLLTTNSIHFPEPYFQETKHWVLEFTDNKNRTSTLVLHLLNVDIKACERSMNEIEYIKDKQLET